MKMRNLVNSDGRLSIRAMSVQLNLDKGTGEKPEIWPKIWILHHDNAPAHKVLSFKQFLAHKSITEMEHRPHSSDLAPNDFWLFPKINSALKRRRFQDTEEIQSNVTMALKVIPQQFQKCFRQWQEASLG
jgi:hypothetical protein